MASEDYLSDLCRRAREFKTTLEAKRVELAPPEFWYPYGSMNNLTILDRLLTGPSRNLLRDIEPKRAADIGAADGDLSFFMEMEGWEMSIVDNPPTNWNGLRGAKLFKERTGSAVKIVEIDLDSQFTLDNHYEVVFALGILYHLKNPFYFLESLSHIARFAFLSTRVTRWSGPIDNSVAADRVLLESLPIAYLLGPAECNNDSTNYWIFSEAGLRRLIARTGWQIVNYLKLGEVENADPFTATNDARSFCLLKSRNCNS